MITVRFDTRPLTNGNAGRGVGMYTKFLLAELRKLPDFHILSGSEKGAAQLLHYPFFDLFFPTLPLLRMRPTVVTIHDLIPLIFPKQYDPGKKGHAQWLKQRVALQTAFAIITDSESSKQDIQRLLKIRASKIHVVPLAANPELQYNAKNSSSKVRQTYNLPAKYVLYVGDINYNKNLPQLIKMLKFLPEEIQLVCVGKNFRPQNIPEWHAIDVQVALSNVSARVKYLNNLGPTATEDLAAIYHGAVAYVQPSLYEGFGLPVLEAMQCRAPVVCARTSSLIEVAGAHAVMAEPTAESLAAGVEQVLSWSYQQRLRTIAEAYDWSQTFSWAKTAAQTAEVYRKVLR